MKNLVVLKTGTYRQNLFKDHLGLIRDCIDDVAQLDFHNSMAGRLQLIRVDDQIMITTPVDAEPHSKVLDMSFVDSDRQFLIFCSVHPITAEGYFFTQSEVVDNATLFYLDEETQRVCYYDTGIPVDETAVYLVPLLTINRLPKHPIYTVAVNGDVLVIANDLFINSKETIVREVWGIDSSTQVMNDLLFNTIVDGDLVVVKGTHFVKGTVVTVRMGGASMLAQTELNFNSGDIIIDCSVPYLISDDGIYMSLDFSNAQPDTAHYLKFYLPHNSKLIPYMSNLNDLPVVDVLFVKK